MVHLEEWRIGVKRNWEEDSVHMVDTGEDREIQRRAKANEAEATRESKKLAAVTKQRSTKRLSRIGVKRSAASKSRS